jgi:hypothetical protein
MLEGVFRYRKDRLLVEKLAVHEAAQRCGELLRCNVGDLGEQRLREFLPDHRGGLQDALLAFGETIDARGQQRLHRGRNHQRVGRCHEPILAACSFELAFVDQPLDHLFSKEGVSRERCEREHGVGATAVAGTSRCRERQVERCLARSDLAEPRQRQRVNEVSFRFACGVVERSQGRRGRGDRLHRRLQLLGRSHHRELASEARVPGAEAGTFPL